MSEDINKTVIVGRLTRDAELMYTNSGTALCKMSIAVNRSIKKGDKWEDEASFFDVALWGKRGEALNVYLVKGQQVAIEGSLRQERWEQDGNKRSRVSIDASNIQLLGGKPAETHSSPSTNIPSKEYTPPAPGGQDRFESDIPFICDK